ncbi:hypothetical protein RB195_024092 [Necator americanus]|uniref:Uncharacterized protein n=1 Tax=Necator americanus TaxID=51031 RepID=A0ABR1ELU1_NECAM
MEKKICYWQRSKKEVYDDCVLEDSLSQGDWHIEEDANVDYETLLRGLRVVLNVPRSHARQTWIEFRRSPRNVGKKKDFEASSECIAH